MELTVKIEGLDEILKKLDGNVLLAKPLKDALEKSAFAVQNQAKLNATGRPGPKVDTGHLRRSIAHQTDSSAIPQWAEVYDRVEYAPSIEFGHRQTLDKISKAGRPYGRFVWAIKAHLVAPFAPAYPFFFRALKESQSQIDSNMQNALKEIEATFNA